MGEGEQAADRSGAVLLLQRIGIDAPEQVGQRGLQAGHDGQFVRLQIGEGLRGRGKRLQVAGPPRPQQRRDRLLRRDGELERIVVGGPQQGLVGAELALDGGAGHQHRPKPFDHGAEHLAGGAQHGLRVRVGIEAHAGTFEELVELCAGIGGRTGRRRRSRHRRGRARHLTRRGVAQQRIDVGSRPDARE